MALFFIYLRVSRLAASDS